MNDGRGVIHHNERFNQPLAFEGIRYGNITPTDVDALIEYKDKAYILCEVKYQGKGVPLGQKIALERMVNDFTRCGKKSIAIIGDHSIHEPTQRIQLKDCKVREIYLYREKVWRKTNKPMSMKDIIDLFITQIVGGVF